MGKRKKSAFFIYFVRREFFNIWVLSHCIVYWINFQNIYTFTYQKQLLHTLLFSKSAKAFSVSLNKEKSSCCLETRYISDVTSKIVSGNTLNQETKKKQIKSASRSPWNVPYLKKVQFIIEMHIGSIGTSKKGVNKAWFWKYV